MGSQTEIYRLNAEGRNPQYVVALDGDRKQWGVYRQSDALEPVKLRMCVSMDEAFAYASALVDDPCDSVMPA